METLVTRVLWHLEDLRLLKLQRLSGSTFIRPESNVMMSMNWFEEILNQCEWVLPWSCAGSHVPVLVLWLWMAALSPLGSLSGMRCDENERPVEQNISPPSRLEPSNWCTTKKNRLLSASVPPEPNPLFLKRIFSWRPMWRLKTRATRLSTNGDSIISGVNAI